MSEAAAEPAPEPLTPGERLEGYLPALLRELAAGRRALDAVKLSPSRQLTDAALMNYERRLTDIQWELMSLGQDIRAAAEVRAFDDLRLAALADGPAPEAPEAGVRRHLRLEPGAGAGSRAGRQHRRALAVSGRVAGRPA